MCKTKKPFNIQTMHNQRCSKCFKSKAGAPERPRWMHMCMGNCGFDHQEWRTSRWPDLVSTSICSMHRTCDSNQQSTEKGNRTTIVKVYWPMYPVGKEGS